MVRWTLLVLTRTAREPHCGVQEPNRLDTAIDRLGEADAGANVRYRSDQWWIAEFQYSEFAENSWKVDENVHVGLALSRLFNEPRHKLMYLLNTF